YNDALVLKDNKLKKITLKSGVQPYGLTISFEGFPFFGIWAARDANFVCLEPWCGIADSVTHDQLLEKKEGIQKIQPGESWSRHWSVELF
ncbi:MAG TPA: aldose 1-epimerase family protein, partial [Cyclobacteriaceae bacterium]|nr:aldose 1-epimerase family protein [Cyclobacteriaceae bacterium]